MKDRNQKDLELFEPFKHDLKKKICLGAVSHRTLQTDRPEDVAVEIRKALKHIPAERLIVSSDCGFGRQGCNRDIAFYKASAIAQGCNIIRGELGLPMAYVPAADPSLQVDVVPGRAPYPPLCLGSSMKTDCVRDGRAYLPQLVHIQTSRSDWR
jgi:5-methyltetrahydropteroyltriglutamate--homocysteine methyltransferase